MGKPIFDHVLCNLVCAFVSLGICLGSCQCKHIIIAEK